MFRTQVGVIGRSPPFRRGIHTEPLWCFLKRKLAILFHFHHAVPHMVGDRSVLSLSCGHPLTVGRIIGFNDSRQNWEETL